eukprot:2551384-Pyramimonas_sp.AAC.1
MPTGPATCRYPLSAPIHWECPGCRGEKERDGPVRAREFGRCRFGCSRAAALARRPAPASASS